MADVAVFALAGVAGVFLGVVFFGGLWWTVRQGLASPRPALWFLGSLLVRTAVVLAGIYVVAAGDWRRMLACVAGFAIARVVVTRLAGPPIAGSDLALEESRHAS